MPAPTPSIEKLLKKLEREPNPLIYLQLAEEYRKEGMHQEALKTCQDGLQRHPNYWSARVSMGRIYYETGDSEKAREELEKVIKAVPDNLLANKLLGDIYRDSGKFEDAMKRYNLVQMLTPADAEVAASIRKIEQSLSQPKSSVEPEQSLKTAEVKAPPLEPIPPQAHEQDSPFSSAPTKILSRSELHSTAEFLPVEPPTIKQKDIAESSTLLDAIHSQERLRFTKEEEAIELQEDSEREDVGELTTQTLADIYIQQGLPDKAVRVYQKLLLKDPSNTELAQKLRELNPADVLFSSSAKEASESGSGGKVRGRESEHPKRRASGVFSGERNRKISTLENWLAAIRRERA
jgi:tetratricopeptide (TPR) repeat protein